ncbi:MAG: hypothetical protein U1E59_15075 [Amaricoccus sp.]
MVIHFPASAQPVASSVQAALAAAGGVDVQMVPVRIEIGRSNVRFYHAEDRDAAAALAALVAPVLPDGDAPEPRDFTDYATPTALGKVEIWLAGAPTGGATSTRASARHAPRVAVAPQLYPDAVAPIEAPSQSQAEAVERILVQRLRSEVVN